MNKSIFNIKTLGEAMRPENLRGEVFRLSRDERDYIAGHALDSLHREADNLATFTTSQKDYVLAQGCSNAARKITALSNLLGDIGWERESPSALREPEDSSKQPTWLLGELFPVAQLRPWLKEWQRQDDEALVLAEQSLEIADLAEEREEAVALARRLIASAQTELGTGAILLARIEKWMACKEN